MWDCIFGGPPIVIETYPDGRTSVNGKFVETPAQTVAGFAASAGRWLKKGLSQDDRLR
jgi:hypothetical protein